MRFWADDDALSAGVTLDGEDVDLADGRGDRALDALCDGMYLCFGNQRDPDGRAWKPLKPATVKAKGGNTYAGLRTGRMLADLHSGRRDIEGASATWSFPPGDTWDRASGFHSLRPFVGWTDEAKRRATEAILGR